MTAPVFLLDLPHHRMVELIGSTDAPVFVAVNPVEFHGPHLSLHNDRLVTEGLSRDLHAALAERRSGSYPYLVAHDLELGAEPCSGPGTRHITYASLREALLETVRALAEVGAKKLVINTFHGGGLHNLAIEAACDAFERAGGRAFAPLAVALQSMVDFDDALLADPLSTLPEPERSRVRETLRFDFHAGWLETSLALHYAPDSVSPEHRSLSPAPSLGRDRAIGLASRVAKRLGAASISAELDFLASAATWTKMRPFLGYTGHPALATREAGRRIASRFVARYVELGEAVLYGAAPSPRAPFRYLPALTLGGRLEPTFVPTSDVATTIRG
ncbi:MAG: creatininase family protein [Polyangiaceae bacterium]|nr:creatininase family protein [Polyangiaceae bacterium]